MSPWRITVVLHPWQSDREEGERLIAEAAGLLPGSPLHVLKFVGEMHPTALADRLVEALGDRDGRQLVLLPTGSESELIAAHVADRCGGASFGRCTALSIDADAVTGRRAAFGGRLELALCSTARITCATLRPGPAAQVPTVETTEIALQAPLPWRADPVPADDQRPRVEGAAMVIAGGRGIGGPEGFEWLSRIASALGAGVGVGGSLPAVDAGWVPVAHQVGQSGKFVAPRVYVAVAISGTPQHMAGVAPTTRIVALNNDRDAPIFSRCDVAVQGDWQDILPLLARELEARRAAA